MKFKWKLIKTNTEWVVLRFGKCVARFDNKQDAEEYISGCVYDDTMPW